MEKYYFHLVPRKSKAVTSLKTPVSGPKCLQNTPFGKKNPDGQSQNNVLFLTKLLSMISLNLTKVSFSRLTRYFLIFCQKNSLELQVSSDIALCMFLVNIFVVISLEVNSLRLMEFSWYRLN